MWCPWGHVDPLPPSHQGLPRPQNQALATRKAAIHGLPMPDLDVRAHVRCTRCTAKHRHSGFSGSRGAASESPQARPVWSRMGRVLTTASSASSNRTNSGSGKKTVGAYRFQLERLRAYCAGRGVLYMRDLSRHLLASR